MRKLNLLIALLMLLALACTDSQDEVQLQQSVDSQPELLIRELSSYLIDNGFDVQSLDTDFANSVVLNEGFEGSEIKTLGFSINSAENKEELYNLIDNFYQMKGISSEISQNLFAPSNARVLGGGHASEFDWVCYNGPSYQSGGCTCMNWYCENVSTGATNFFTRCSCH